LFTHRRELTSNCVVTFSIAVVIRGPTLFSEDGSSPLPTLYDIDIKTVGGGSLASSEPFGPQQADSPTGA
jgi:hypothetical protein